MDLPAHTNVTGEQLRALARSLGAATASPLPEVGIFNAIHALGDSMILRIPRDHPAFIEATCNEALAAPAAKGAGVRTPALIRFDDSLELIPVPYTVYERVHGTTLGIESHAVGSAAVWREVGRDLAKLHAGVPQDGPISALEKERLPDPARLVEEMVRDGHFTTLEATWLHEWLERLRPAADGFRGARLLHGDVQMTNVMVDSDGRYLALLDWGAAGWGDPAEDFAGVPLRVVPSMLEGYQDIHSLDQEDSADARILYRHLQIALFLLRRPAMPGRSWAERPLGAMLETLFCVVHEERWRRLVL